MKKVGKWVLGAALLAVGCAGKVKTETPPTWGPPAVTGSTDLAFEVDLSARQSVAADTALRVGLTAYIHEALPEFSWNQVAAELRLGTVLLDPIWLVTTASTSLADARVRLAQLDPYVRRVVNAGGRVRFVFQGIPRWLSPDPNNNTAVTPYLKVWYALPPNDWTGWRAYTQAFAQHFNVDLGLGASVGYMIGSEPDNYWLGSEDDFHLYYKYGALGVRDASPDAPLAGITPAHHAQAEMNLTHAPTANGQPLLRNFLEYAAAESLPVDEITWHSYPGGNPVYADTTVWGRAHREISTWQAASGYGAATQLMTDWPDWRQRPQNDGTYHSAWVASGIIASADLGLYGPTHMLRDGPIDDAAAAANAGYGGGNGMINKAGAIKATYNVYRLISSMQGSLVSVQTGDPFISALAAVASDGTVAILLSYFVPEDWHLPANDLLTTFDVNAAQAELEATGLTNEQLGQIAVDVAMGVTDPDSLPYSENVRSYLRALRDLKLKADERRTLSVLTGLTVRGMADGTYEVQRQIVGRDPNDHVTPLGDPYAHRAILQAAAQSLSGLEDPNLPAVVGGFNSSDGVGLMAPRLSEVQAVGGRVSVVADLSPYDVQLLMLKPR